MKVDNRRVIIDVSEIDQTSYEALEAFAKEYSYTEIGKLISEWLDKTAWDVAAWYIGDDL